MGYKSVIYGLKEAFIMSKFILMAENKLVLLYFMYQMDAHLSNTQLIEFAIDGEYMDYFSFNQYMKELEKNGLVESFMENNNTFYSITATGEQTLNFFSKQIPESKRNNIINYVRKTKETIRRDFEVSANYFYNGENDYIVKCGVYENDTTLIELNVSVVNKEQAKLVRKNWRQNTPAIYVDILSAVLDADIANTRGQDLKTSIEKRRKNKM